LQVVQDGSVELSVVAIHAAKSLSLAGSKPVGFHRLIKAILIHLQPILFEDIAGDLQRETKGGVEVEGGFAIKLAFTIGFEARHLVLKFSKPGIERFGKTLFLRCQCFIDQLSVSLQLGVSSLVVFNHEPGDMRHEWLGQVELARETGGTADDHAADIVATDIAGDDAVSDQESSGSHMVSNHAVGRQVGGAFRVRLPGEVLGLIQKRFEKVSFVVPANALNDRNDAFKPHAGIHVPLGQRQEVAGGGAVILDEDVIPDLNDARAIAVDFTHMPGYMLHVAEVRPKIIMDLGTGTARSGFSHFPEVILAATLDKVRGDETRLCQPDVAGFLIRGQVALVVDEVGCV